MDQDNYKRMPDEMVERASLVNQTYSYINNAGFYTALNPTYYDYYMRVVRPCSQWLDGYVFQFHNIERGFFSTRLASTLVNGIGNHVVGQRLYIEKNNKDTDKEVISFATKWSEKHNFQEAVRNAIKMSIGLGTSLLKLNKSSKDLWVEDVRLDYFFFEEDAVGNLTDVTVMLKGYYNVNHSQDKDKQDNYYLVEHRYFKPIFAPRFKNVNGKNIWNKATVIDRKPMVEYSVYKYTGNSMSGQTFTPKGSGKMQFNSLPYQVRTSLRDNYDIRELDVAKELPFDHYLGCELLKNDGKDITLPNTPFGRPMILDIQSDLMAYDMAFSYEQRDMYLGKGAVIVPKSMANPAMQSQSESVFNGFDEAFFMRIPALNPDDQTPISIQFQLRVDEWNKKKDDILRRIATKIGMSPKTIASYIEENGSSRKTATEIDAEDDATISYISIKRAIYEKSVNRILNCAMNFYGKVGEVKIKFSTPSLVNIDKIVDRVVKLKQIGVLTDKMALQMIYPDDDADEIEAKIEELKQYRLEQNIEEENKQLFNVQKGEVDSKTILQG